MTAPYIMRGMAKKEFIKVGCLDASSRWTGTGHARSMDKLHAQLVPALMYQWQACIQATFLRLNICSVFSSCIAGSYNVGKVLQEAPVPLPSDALVPELAEWGQRRNRFVSLIESHVDCAGLG